MENSNIPGANHSTNDSIQDISALQPIKGHQWVGYILAILTGISSAGCYQAVTKFLETDEPWLINFWIGLVGGSVLLFLMLLFEMPQLRLPSRLPCIGYFLVVAILQYQLSTPYCLQYMDPSIYSLIRAMELPLLFVLQYILHDIVRPPKANWIGIIGTIVCCIGVLLGPVVQLLLELRDTNASTRRHSLDSIELDENLNECTIPLLSKDTDENVSSDE